jgi:protein-tyrosine phosphatase
MKILFICHANMCRSVMAQYLLKKYLPQAETFSRGLYAETEQTVPENVVRFLAEQGISLTEHQPSQLTPQDLENADWVFCMEPWQVEKLTDRYAQYTDKIWLLNEFAFGKETAVEDPVNLSGRAFTKVAKKLQDAVIACAERLNETK